MEIDPSLSTIYQYDYKLYDEKNHLIEPDSRLYRQFIKQTQHKLKDVLGFEMAKGQIAYCRKNEPTTNIAC